MSSSACTQVKLAEYVIFMLTENIQGFHNLYIVLIACLTQATHASTLVNYLYLRSFHCLTTIIICFYTIRSCVT